jgi:hypothetical protein
MKDTRIYNLKAYMYTYLEKVCDVDCEKKNFELEIVRPCFSQFSTVRAYLSGTLRAPV